MTPPGQMSGHHETARQQSRAAWGAVASGWYAQREDIWKASHPVSEWMVRKLDPQVGDTVLEVADGIMSQGFEPTPSYAACSICDYRIVCPAAER